MKCTNFKIYSYFVFLLVMTRCTEPFIIETIDFENLLVVEGTITNELKHQIIKLSRTTPLENFEPDVENNAIVEIEDSEGNIFNFTQNNDSGAYMSDQKFQAIPNINYILKIKTANGKEYFSSEKELTPSVEIGKVYAELSDDNGFEGVQVYLDTYDISESAKFFKFEFIETYKIRAPEPSNWSWEFTNYDFVTDLYEINLSRRKPEIFCYSSNNSEGIIQASTNNLNENNIIRKPIQFIFKNNSILRERYSILVKQYTQSPEAFTYYKITEELGSVESRLSESQPGFVNGNITSKTDPNEKVIGFFDVNSVTSKRIYFNYFDFGLPFPPYFTTCNELEFYANTQLKNLIEQKNFQIQDYKTGGEPNPRYIIYQDICTDCTTFSSNIKPEFWED